MTTKMKLCFLLIQLNAKHMLTSLLFFLLINVFNTQDKGEVDIRTLYQKALVSNYFVNFDKFYERYQSLSKEQQLIFMREEKYGYQLMEYHNKVLLRKPSDSLFYLQIKLENILDGEYQESILENFSIYFRKNLTNSLRVCERLENENILKSIIRSSLFHEPSGLEILKMVKSRDFKKKNYYKYYLEYF